MYLAVQSEKQCTYLYSPNSNVRSCTVRTAMYIAGLNFVFGGVLWPLTKQPLTCPCHLSLSPVPINCPCQLTLSPVPVICPCHFSLSLVPVTCPCPCHLSLSPVPILGQINHSTPPHLISVATVLILSSHCIYVFQVVCILQGFSARFWRISLLLKRATRPAQLYKSYPKANSSLSATVFLVVVVEPQTVQSHANQIVVKHCTKKLNFSLFLHKLLAQVPLIVLVFRESVQPPCWDLIQIKICCSGLFSTAVITYSFQVSSKSVKCLNS